MNREDDPHEAGLRPDSLSDFAVMRQSHGDGAVRDQSPIYGVILHAAPYQPPALTDDHTMHVTIYQPRFIPLHPSYFSLVLESASEVQLPH